MKQRTNSSKPGVKRKYVKKKNTISNGYMTIKEVEGLLAKDVRRKLRKMEDYMRRVDKLEMTMIRTAKISEVKVNHLREFSGRIGFKRRMINEASDYVMRVARQSEEIWGNKFSEDMIRRGIINKVNMMFKETLNYNAKRIELADIGKDLGNGEVELKQDEKFVEAVQKNLLAKIRESEIGNSDDAIERIEELFDGRIDGRTIITHEAYKWYYETYGVQLQADLGEASLSKEKTYELLADLPTSDIYESFEEFNFDDYANEVDGKKVIDWDL